MTGIHCQVFTVVYYKCHPCHLKRSILLAFYSLPFQSCLSLIQYPLYKSFISRRLFAATDEIHDTAQSEPEMIKGLNDSAALEGREDFGGEFDFFPLLEEQTVSIASKIEERASKAPSIVTVITAEEIENIGARTLSEILRIVPGFDIIKDGDFGDIALGVRGVRDSGNRIKVYIDGHSINMPFDGKTSFFFDDLSLKNVKRIEIIRGPGSSLYGANAFLAVINIITKGAEDIDGIEFSSGFGSFDTQEYAILFGKDLYGIDIAGFADLYNTNGLSDTIKEDALFGQPFVNRFSIAPGDTDDSRNKLDLNLKLSYKDIELKTKYMNKDTEPFVGLSFVLTDDGENRFNYTMAELSYKLDIGERLTFKPRAYYDQYDIEFGAEAFPDGFIIPDDLDMDGDIELFPDGVRGRPIATNRRLGAEMQFDYKPFDNNTLVRRGINSAIFYLHLLRG